NATVGAFTVTASVAGVATPATFRLQNVSTGPAAVFIVSGNQQTTPTGAAFASRLVVVVADASGNSLPGVTVNFAAQTGSSSATANSISGRYAVAASTPNAPTAASFDLTNECTADSQCTLITPICDSSTRSCIACATNTQCSTKNASQPWCDASGSCFACTADSQCSGSTPICSQATNSCATCTTDAQCGNKDPANPYCLPSGTCISGYTITS